MVENATLSVFFPQNTHNSLIMRRTLDKSQLYNLIQIIWPNIRKIVKVTEHQGSLGNLPKKKPNEPWGLHAMFPGWDSETNKQTNKKGLWVKQINAYKVWTFVNNNVSISVHW